MRDKWTCFHGKRTTNSSRVNPSDAAGTAINLRRWVLATHFAEVYPRVLWWFSGEHYAWKKTAVVVSIGPPLYASPPMPIDSNRAGNISQADNSTETLPAEALLGIRCDTHGAMDLWKSSSKAVVYFLSHVRREIRDTP